MLLIDSLERRSKINLIKAPVLTRNQVILRLCCFPAAWTKFWRWLCGSGRPTWWSSREWVEPFTPTTTPCSAARASRWPLSKTRGWPTDWGENCSAWSSSMKYQPGNQTRTAVLFLLPERDRSGLSWSSECKEDDRILPLSEQPILTLTVKNVCGFLRVIINWEICMFHFKVDFWLHEHIAFLHIHQVFCWIIS